MREHLHTSENQVAESRALPSVNEAFASTQAAWRFYANLNVSLEGLLAPLIEQARREMPLVCKQYGLAIHDWSDLPYQAHTSKKDRRKIGSGLGYRLATTLLISDLTGTPIAPISLRLLANDGWHTTFDEKKRADWSPLDLVSETMPALQKQQLPFPLVHIIDREGDSIFHHREWNGAGELFLIRANGSNRIVWHERTQLLGVVAAQIELRAGQAVEISANVSGQLMGKLSATVHDFLEQSCTVAESLPKAHYLSTGC